MVTDEERHARAALTHLCEPADAELGRHLDQRGAVRVVQQITDGTLPSPRIGGYQVRLPSLDTERDLRRCTEAGGRFICPGDHEWPTQLDDLGVRRPFGLWVLGTNLRLAVVRSVAVVGSRSSTDYGEYVAAEMAASLGERGWTVVSGGAFGIDSAAHRGALAVEGLTVVVLASGVDVPYPRGNHGLLRRIADDGVVASEVPPGRRPARFRFLERNRLLAALSRGTVVVEAGYRSGALNTARWADELGRHVMGVPGPVTSAASAGVHRMLRDQRAVLVTDIAEVVEQVGVMGDDIAPRPEGHRDPRDGLSPTVARVLDAMPPNGSVSESTVAQMAGVELDSVRRCLGILEMSAWVTRTCGGWGLQTGGNIPQ